MCVNMEESNPVLLLFCLMFSKLKEERKIGGKTYSDYKQWYLHTGTPANQIKLN